MKLKDYMRAYERQCICKMLQNCYCNVKQTAKALGIGESSLYRKMKQHKIVRIKKRSK